ncbi:hypothetical protein Tco_1359833 [Tanacetum coccineum]
MKMEILLESISNKLMVLERFNTSAGNPVKKILLKLNLSDHRLCKMVVEVKICLKVWDCSRCHYLDDVVNDYCKIYIWPRPLNDYLSGADAHIWKEVMKTIHVDADKLPKKIGEAYGVCIGILACRERGSPSLPFYPDATTFSDGKPASETPELNPEDMTARLEDIEVEIDTLHADTEDKELLISELQDFSAASKNDTILAEKVAMPRKTYAL